LEQTRGSLEEVRRRASRLQSSYHEAQVAALLPWHVHLLWKFRTKENCHNSVDVYRLPREGGMQSTLWRISSSCWSSSSCCQKQNKGIQR
jgi:hypothetical protein